MCIPKAKREQKMSLSYDALNLIYKYHKIYDLTFKMNKLPLHFTRFMKGKISIIIGLSLITLASFTNVRLHLANKKVLEYVESVMDTKVGVGECSDLIFNAQFYLKKHKITSSSKSRKILPGDFISFRNAIFKGENTHQLTFTEHHAIVYEVIAKKEIIIVHQNHNDVRIVKKLRLNLNDLSSGKFNITHP